MANNVKPVPKGFRTATPYLIVKDAARAIEFYRKAFRAKERARMAHPDGRVVHAEIKIGNSIIMLADEFPEMSEVLSPQSRGGSTAFLYLYVKDVDRVFARATKAGATVLRPVKDQFYGDRSGAVKDPFGHVWHIATHTEDLSEEEIKKRAAAQAQS